MLLRHNKQVIIMVYLFKQLLMLNQIWLFAFCFDETGGFRADVKFPGNF